MENPRKSKRKSTFSEPRSSSPQKSGLSFTKSKTSSQKSESLRQSRLSSRKSVRPQSDFYNSAGSFTLPNGDAYFGDYCAHRNGMLWREGKGSYFTKDGQVYDGYWQDDKLIDLSPISILYANGDLFTGTCNKNQYENSGEITFNDGFIRLNANFTENKPSGSVFLIDNVGQLWKGNSEPNRSSETNDPDKIYCRPEQVFFNNIHPLRGIKKEILKHIQPVWAPSGAHTSYCSDEGSADEYFLTDKQIEEMIFAKKDKIDTNIVWEDSPWYQEFVAYKKRREMILRKVDCHEKLTTDEIKWYNRYAIAKRQRTVQKTVDDKVDTSLLQRFYSDEHKHSAKPYSTFYPSYYWHTQPETVDTEPSTQDYVQSIQEVSESVEEEVKSFESETKEESMEYVSPNPSIACGTSSLFDLITKTLGDDFGNKCESKF